MAEAATLKQEQITELDQLEALLPPEYEHKSFDVLASTRMFRYDLRHFGRVLPETRQRVADEELSYMVEGIDRASRTEFVLQRKGDDLAYYKNGRWESYTQMVINGAEVEKRQTQHDYRRGFLAEAASRDVAHVLRIRKLKPGEQYVYYSAYDQAAEDRYGQEFMSQNGMKPDRKMGLIYRAYCTETGDVVLQSQTVDNSNQAGFDRVMRAFGDNPSATMDDYVRAYDAAFTGNVYAGRQQSEIGENAWRFIQAQSDLVKFFISRLEAIASQPLKGGALEEAVKRHTYGAWAAFKRRLDEEGVETPTYQSISGVSLAHLALLEQEVHRAFTDFASRGVAMVGCGGRIEVLQGEQDMLNASGDTMYKSIFGEGASDRFGPLTFHCLKGHTNTRRRGELLTQCKVKGCHDSVGCGPKKAETPRPDKRHEISKKYGKYATSMARQKQNSVKLINVRPRQPEL